MHNDLQSKQQETRYFCLLSCTDVHTDNASSYRLLNDPTYDASLLLHKGTSWRSSL